MKKSLLFGALVAVGAFCLQDITLGHGGTYHGPGDTVPPGGANRGGGNAPPAPSGPSLPSSPTPGNPSTPTPTTPGQTPTGPRSTAPLTGLAADLGPDLTAWDFWWGFNKQPYLNLRRKVRSRGVQSGDDQLYLGRGTEAKKQASLRPGEDLVRNVVVPALMEALETEEQNDIVTGALIALAKIGDVRTEEGKSEFVGIISGFLKAQEQEISETAALALGILADDRAVPALVGLMRDDVFGRGLMKSGGSVPFRTRSFAGYGLGLVGNRTNSNEVRQVIAGHLIDILEMPKFAQPDIQVGALQGLGLIPLNWRIEGAVDGEGANAALDRLSVLRFLTKKMNPIKGKGGFEDFRVRAQAPIACARLLAVHEEQFPGDEEAIAVRGEVIKTLLGLVAAQSKEKRAPCLQSATIALGMIGNAAKGGKDDQMAKANVDIFRELQRIAKNAKDNQTEYFALMAMAQMGSRPGAGDDARGLEADVQKALIGALAKGKGQKRPWAAIALGVFGNALNENGGTLDPAVRVVLRDRATDGKSPVEYGAFAIALGLIGDQDAADILLGKLDSLGTGLEEVRGNICVGLGLMEASGASEALNDTVRASKFRPGVLQQAAIGLGLLGDKEAVPLLLEMLEDAKGLSSQAAIASALGTIGDVNAVDGLVKMLAGKTEKKMTDTARGFAAVALGITCDKEDFPWNTKISVNTNYRANVLTLTSPNGTGILDIL